MISGCRMWYSVRTVNWSWRCALSSRSHDSAAGESRCGWTCRRHRKWFHHPHFPRNTTLALSPVTAEKVLTTVLIHSCWLKWDHSFSSEEERLEVISLMLPIFVYFQWDLIQFSIFCIKFNFWQTQIEQLFYLHLKTQARYLLSSSVGWWDPSELLGQ